MSRDQDPRLYQIMCLVGMFAYGLFWLKFDLSAVRIAGIIGVALLSQVVASRAVKIRFEWKSAMISALSLCLLMRTDSLALALGLTAAAIGSKFLFRFHGKHVFNPTSFALALGTLTTSHVWVSPGQWGNGAVLAFFIACMGTFVVNRAARSDVTFSFLGAYALGLVVAREPLLRLASGSLLVFAFFMISDPKTTPNSRVARIFFSILVAGVGTYLQLERGMTSGLIVSLALLSPLVAVLDSWLPDRPYGWVKKGLEGFPLSPEPDRAS